MPHFRLETNLPREKIPPTFVNEAVGVVAKTLGKPESYCLAAVIPDVLMTFGGQEGPCGSLRIMSIGKLGVQENKKHSAALVDLIEKKLGIPRDRMYIHFIDETSANVGYNGTTFHDILG